MILIIVQRLGLPVLLRGRLGAYLYASIFRPSNQTNHMNLPGAWVTRPGYGAASPTVPGPKPPLFFVTQCKNHTPCPHETPIKA